VFVYTNDLKTREKLEQQGFKLITKKEKEGKVTWIFDFNENIQMPNLEDTDSYYMSKKMSF